MRCNNRRFPSLNVLNGKTSQYGSKLILRHYRYLSDPKLGLGIVVIRRITCNYYTCTNILSLSWDSKIKEAVDQPRYGRVYSFKYSQIIGCHHNCILMKCFDDGTDE